MYEEIMWGEDVGECLPAERAEPVEEVEHEGDHVHGHHHQDPERVSEGLQERDQRRQPRLLGRGYRNMYLGMTVI